MEPFAPRDRAALDYWFWKFHVGELAFLVDLIIRRRTGLAEVRVSQWLRGAGRVVHAETGDWSSSANEVRIGETVLRPGRCAGLADDIEWDLSWHEGFLVAAMRGLVVRMQPFDTTLVVWPEARFTGTVRVGSELFTLTQQPGAFYHYWGRRLADRWVWLSATEFEGAPALRAEALLAARTRIYGRVPAPLPISWLWVSDGRRRTEVLSGVNALVRVHPEPRRIELRSRGLGGSHRLVAGWGSAPPNDIGEGIVQTMHGDLELDGFRAVPGTVGLEVRGYPHPPAGAR